MVDFKGVFQGYQLINDDVGERLVIDVKEGEKLVSILATEAASFFSYYCEGLEVGERVCISGSPKWQSDDAASLEKYDFYISRMSRYPVQSDGRGAYICNGYCDASRNNEEEFGRSNVCLPDSPDDPPAFPPDVPGAFKSGLLKEVQRYMPVQEKDMFILNQPGRSDEKALTYVRPDDSHGIMKVLTDRPDRFIMTYRKHSHYDGKVLSGVLNDLHGRVWVDELGVSYRLDSFSWNGGGQAKVKLFVDTSGSDFWRSTPVDRVSELSIWMHSEFEEDDR